MAIPTSNLDSGADRPREARGDLLQAVQVINNIYSPDTGGLSTAAVISAIEGAISESELNTTLGNKISLIVADDTVVGSVAQRIKAEADARALAIAAEATARTNALVAEAQARSDEIEALNESITDAFTAEAAARTAAIQSEATARGNALLAEATARGNAITSEATLRTNADTAIAQTVTTLTTTVNNNHTAALAAVSNEATARADADTAVAGTVTTLAAQMRGTYTGTDVALVTTGLIHSEREARVTATSALSQRIDTLQAGVAGQQIDASLAWQFDTTVEGWTGNGAPTTSGGFLVPAAHATAPYVISPLVGLTASLNNMVQLRIKKIGTPTWLGQFLWARAGDSGWDTTNRKATIPEPGWDANAIGYATLSISSANWSGTINQIRIALSSFQSASQGYQIDWVAVGRPGPGASTASLVDEATARAAADSAEVASRQSLSAKITGVNDPSGVSLTSLTSGLLFDERTARVNADSAEVTARQSLSAKVTGVNDPSGVTLATLSAGLLYDEKTARATADAAEVTARQSLSAKITGANDPASLTLATLSSGLLYEEKTARVNADSAEVTARQSLSAKITGANDPSSLTLATLASGLLYEEKTARATQDSALATSITTLTAKVNNVRRWSNSVASVKAGVNTTLTMGDGTTAFQNPDSIFSPSASKSPIVYYVEATKIGTAPAAGASALFTCTWSGTAWVWTVQLVYEVGQAASDIKLFISSGIPAMTLYSSTTAIRVDYSVEQRLVPYSPEAAVVNEATARATADTAEATSRQALSTKLTGVADPASLTLATLSSGLIYDERVARTNADSSEVTARQALATKVTGSADPSSLTLATLSSGLIFEEKTARTSDISSVVTRVTSLEASSAQTMPGAFEETWDGTALDRWVNTGSGEMSIVSITDSVSGGKVLRGGNNNGNDAVNVYSKARIALDPAVLYKLTVTVRRTAGSGTFYAGFVAYGADGTTPINTTGANSLSSQYYRPSNVAPGSSWTTYTNYFKLGTVYGGTGSLANPMTFRSESRYIAPLFLLNNASATGTMEVDRIVIEPISTEVLAHESSITTLQTTVADPVSGNTALASRATALEAIVNNPTTGVAATATALDTVKLTVNNSTSGNVALANRTSALETTVSNPTTGLAKAHALIAEEATTRATGDAANASSINTVSARLNSGGDVYNSIVTAKSTADTAKNTADTAASNITSVQSWIQSKGTNLAQNSSFETKRTDFASFPYPAGWGGWGTASNYTLKQVAGRTGGYGFAIVATGSLAYGVSTTVFNSSPLASTGVLGGWKPNTTYVISFYAKKVNGASITTTQLSWGVAPTTTVTLLNPALQTTWQRYAFRITWGASVQADGRIQFGRNGTTAAGDELWFDDVMVTEGDALEGYAPGLGDGVGQLAAVEVEASTRASETGHLGAQYSVRMTAGNVAGGFGLMGTSSSNAGGTIDFGIRANKFFIAPPEGSSVTTSVYPFTVYTTATTLPSGVVVQPGVYMKSAFVDYIQASQIDTRGLSIRDASGNVILSAGTPLSSSMIDATTKPGSMNLVDTTWWKEGAAFKWAPNENGPVPETFFVTDTGYNGQTRTLIETIATSYNRVYTPQAGGVATNYWYPARTDGVNATVAHNTTQGWTADGSTTYSGNCFTVTKTALSIASSGFASQAVAVTPGEQLRIRVRVRGNTATATGLFIRLHMSTEDPVAYGSITNSTATASYDLAANGACNDTYTTYQNLAYTVPAGIKSMSLAIFSWTNGPTVLYVDDPCINSTAYPDISIGPRENTDGGWNGTGTGFNIDPTKTYRFVTFVNMVAGDAAAYWGPTVNSVCTINTDTLNSNPYFVSSIPSLGVVKGEWYAAVGYVYPAGSQGQTTTSAGLYRVSTGEKVRSGTNYCWPENATTAAHRAMQWQGSTGAVVRFDAPQVHVVDGTEPPLRSFFSDATQLNTAVSIDANGTLQGGGGGQVTISGLGYSGDLNATNGAPAGTMVNGVPVANITTAVTNFNASNDRNSAAVTSPAVPTNGSAVDHVIMSDGSANISFEWTWGGNEGDIDGFFVYVYGDSSSNAYTFGTTPSAEQVYTVPANKRAFFLLGAAANLFWHFGVQAYRSVDKDINSAGVIKSSLVKPSATGEVNGYQPSTTIAFSGDITGTVNGTAASVLVTNAANGATAYTGTAALRNTSAPTNNASFGALTQTQTADGNIVVSVPISYTQGTVKADNLLVFYREGGGTVVATDPAYLTNAASTTEKFVLKPSTTYTFGVQAVRTNNNGLVGTSIATSSSITTNAANFTGNVNGTAASTVVTNAANGAVAYATVNDANNGLSSRLRRNADETLQAVMTVNTTYAAGLRVGNLVWNAAGVVQSGKGVAITPGGLVGVNAAGNTTFQISTNGDATFSGTLSVVSGTTGARTEITNSKIVVYDSSNAVRVKIGYLL